jgi:hypothetical protein
MRIFIAHSQSDKERTFASTLSKWLRDAGNDCFSGDEIVLRMRSTGWMTWRESIFESNVNRYLTSADILIAVCLERDWREQNVLFEIGYFLRDSGRERIVIIKAKDALVPDYLQAPRVIKYSQRNTTQVFRALKQHIDQLHESDRKQRRQFFLSYASDDLEMVKPLYRWFLNEGYNIWFDRMKLIVGEEWDRKIIHAIRDSIGFIACFSKKSVDKRGYFQKELRRSLDVASEYPDGSVYILPVRLDDCAIPSDFEKYQWCDLNQDDGKERLRAAMERAIDQDRRRMALVKAD